MKLSNRIRNVLARARDALVYTVPLALFGFAFGQPTIEDPTTWFSSPEGVVLIGGFIGTFAVNILTALGKNVGGTSGYQTVVLSGVVSIVLALLAGLAGVGVFTQGPLPAVGAVLWSSPVSVDRFQLELDCSGRTVHEESFHLCALPS